MSSEMTDGAKVKQIAQARAAHIRIVHFHNLSQDSDKALSTPNTKSE